MPANGNQFFRTLALGALLGAQACAFPALAADASSGYEGWAFSTADSALARDPLAGYNRADAAAGGTAYAAPQGLQLSRTLDNGLALDAGMARGREHAVEPLGLSRHDYHDAFLGFRYQGFSGQVWYLDEPQNADGDRSFYYQAGWKAPVSERLSLSLQMGQSYRQGVGFDQGYPDLSIAAEGDFDSYGLGIRLIDRSGLGLAGEDNGYSLMGSFRKRFP